MTITTFLIVCTIIYLVSIGLLVIGFDRIENFSLKDVPAKTKFTVVIPFRNEANNLTALLESIARLNYTKSHYEVILINDDSSDRSLEFINAFLKKQKSFPKNSIRVFDNVRHTNSPKKDAITLAINQSQNDWIITTDADCILPFFWLDTFDETIQASDSVGVVGPVTLTSQNSFINRFQTLEILALQGATIGSFGINKPIMCNGANFCYKKSAFHKCDGFKGNDSIASGDDLFLLEKFQNQYKSKIQYLKSEKAIVLTKGEKNFNAIVQQRLRWASKTSNYSNWFSKYIGLVVLLGNLSFILILALLLFGTINTRIAVSLMVIKVSIDFLLLFKSARFFKQENQLSSFVFSSFLYPFFNVYIAMLSFFIPYKWKGRTFKK
ncbi:glycosyltransferase [Winogradskyella sp. A2]|uniref:glycosyltransferase n=1 Tax=Winogradskyella sp. A2 TaxID=3366944 RepID=UPI00398C471C